MMLQMMLYGPLGDAGDSLITLVRSFNRRQLMAAIVGGTNMGSAVVAAMVMANIRSLYQASFGLCARFVTYHVQRIMQEPTASFLVAARVRRFMCPMITTKANADNALEEKL